MKIKRTDEEDFVFFTTPEEFYSLPVGDYTGESSPVIKRLTKRIRVLEKILKGERLNYANNIASYYKQIKSLRNSLSYKNLTIYRTRVSNKADLKINAIKEMYEKEIKIFSHEICRLYNIIDDLRWPDKD